MKEDIRIVSIKNAVNTIIDRKSRKNHTDYLFYIPIIHVTVMIELVAL